MSEIEEILISIQDDLVPKLDTYEQAIHHYIFRHTYLKNETKMWFTARSANIGFGGKNDIPPNGRTRSIKLLSLANKGAIKIIDKSHKDKLVEIILPANIVGLIEEEKSTEINIDELDFYKDRRLLNSILERENGRCFYTGRKITEDSCCFDHVKSVSNGAAIAIKIL